MGFCKPLRLFRDQKPCRSHDCFGEVPLRLRSAQASPARSPQRIRPFADETPAPGRQAACAARVLVVPPVSQLPPSQGYGVTGRRDLTLRLRWGSRFCGFAGFRWCAACGCSTTGKIFIRSSENVVFDE